MIQFFSKRLNNKKGFTLVELLIVIALLGILAGIAIPRMTGLTENAKANADTATVQTLMRDAQVAIVSGQLYLTTDSESYVLVGAATGIEDGYFDDYAMPKSQVTGNTYTISIKQQAGSKIMYDIQISDGTNNTVGVAEKVK